MELLGKQPEIELSVELSVELRPGVVDPVPHSDQCNSIRTDPCFGDLLSCPWFDDLLSFPCFGDLLSC